MSDALAQDEIRNGMLRLTYALRDGLVAAPLTEDTAASWWLKLANEGDYTQRASAFIVLLNMGVGMKLAFITEEAGDGLVVNSSG